MNNLAANARSGRANSANWPSAQCLLRVNRVTFEHAKLNSVYPQQTDLNRPARLVRFVPKAEVIPTRGVAKHRLCDTSRMTLLSHFPA